MGNGLLPGPANGPGSPEIDEGTLPRAGTPPPGSIGLDTKGAKTPQQSLSDRVLAFARQRIGQVHGDGECFTLADDALRHAGAKSAADFGKVGLDVDYVWGPDVARAALQPGDIIQMRDYRAEITTNTDHADGSAESDTHSEDRPHHTAIVESVGGGGTVTVLEQNFPDGSAVTRNILHLTDSTSSSGATTTQVTVKGTLRFYRPQAR
ncbi:hypothetical protein LuPra_01319 [Luteitalea pratensis]|uniref:BBC1/AIM3 cysteine proteinase-fold domain-containing protein n=1 Tax=Luteitalea pratensis TaxID=1855912 RepID=A0A143PHZ8_LUTPR|nr:CHAP domain-containing protein [Luteitalea pratensis]AMY08131.1 hypothetical protein LuPra_01319 [Luteitalea pratensis]